MGYLLYLAAFLLGCVVAWPFVAGRWKTKMNAATDSLSAKLGSAEKRAREAAEARQTAETKIAALSTRLDESGRSLTVAREDAASAAAERDRVSFDLETKMNAALGARDTEIGSLTSRIAELDGVADEVTVRDARIGELESALRSATAAKARHEGEVGGLRSEARTRFGEIKSLTAALEERSEHVLFLQDETAGSLSEKDRTIASLEKRVAPIGEMENEIGTLRGRVKEIDSLQAALAERDRELASFEQRVARMGEMENEIGTLRGRVKEIDSLQAALAERDRELASFEQRVARMGEMENEIGTLRGRVREIDSLQAALAERDRKLASFEQRVARMGAMESELGSLKGRLGEIDDLSAALDERNDHVLYLEEENSSAFAERDRSIASLQRKLGEQESEMRTLRGRVAQAQSAQKPHAQSAEKQVAERDERISRLQSERNKTVAQRDRTIENLERRVSSLEPLTAQVAERDRRIVSADTEIAALRRRLEERKGATPAAPAAVRASGIRKPAPRSRPKDELQRIKGIGPKFEGILNGMGVFRYGEIASWSGDDIARVAERLESFPSRIHRDAWIAQARELHSSKYDG